MTEATMRGTVCFHCFPLAAQHGYEGDATQGGICTYKPPQVNAVQKSYPELIPNISSCRSPQMMLASVIKRVWAPSMGLHADEVVNVSIMPCTAKKHEAAMAKFDHVGGGHKTLDYVLTTREFAHMLRHAKVRMTKRGEHASSCAPQVALPALQEGQFDSPLGTSTGAAALFGTSGGVMEAAVRTLYHMLTGEELETLELSAVRGLQVGCVNLSM